MPHIRAATSVDIDLIFPMLEKLCAMHQSLDPARYNFLPDLKPLYIPWLTNLISDSRHLVLVAEAAPSPSLQLVGFLFSTLEKEIPIYQIKEYGCIHDLWVEEAYRKQGIARQMVNQTIEHYRQQGVTQIRLSTVLNNENARHLYESCGFRASTIDMLIELS